jgi:uncharacterized protein YbjQ (UPF0145 family)
MLKSLPFSLKSNKINLLKKSIINRPRIDAEIRVRPWQKKRKEEYMILTNVESVPGKTITEHFGIVSGSTVRAKHVGRDIMAGLKNIVGGELKGYTELLQESRKQATDRMIKQAQQLGANAIVNIRYATSSVAQGASELYVYGTAVKVG